MRLLEWGTLMVAFWAGLITATRKDKVAPFLLGWGRFCGNTLVAQQAIINPRAFFHNHPCEVPLCNRRILLPGMMSD